MDITKDIRPLTEFKRDTARFAGELRASGRPAVLTVNGRPELVVMAAGAWQSLRDDIEAARTIATIRKGLDQAKRGKGTAARALFTRLRKKTRRA